MYTETRNNFSIRSVILQFLFVALFVFILIWLFPMKSDMKKAISSIDNSDNNLSILYDRIFNENLLAMKESAKDYFTLQRLPQKVGDSTKLTLRQMLDKKIILPFVDKNGKQCDLDASYVLVTKHDEEYVMKVNLKCGKEENYLIVNMGCYDYCKGTICEKKTTPTKVVTTTKKKVTTTKYYCKYVNGKYYDNKGKIVTKTAYEKACVKKPEVKKYYCKIVNGKYYDNKGNVVSKETYVKACTKPEEVEKTYYCEIVNGKYYNATGKIVTKEEYEDSCIEKEPEYQYLYEYKKVTEGTTKYSDWSSWSTTAVSPSSTREVQTKQEEVKKLIGYNVKTVNDLTKPIFKAEKVVVGSTTVTACGSYNLTTTVTGYEEKYIGTVKLTSAPTSTTSLRYEAVGTYNWYCNNDCTSGTVYLYKVYQRTPVTSSLYSCSSYKSFTTAYEATKTVLTGYEKKQEKVPVYDTYSKTYYRYRTKTKTTGETYLKWSTYNDTKLLSDNYHYTGNVKIEMITK